MNQRHSLFTYRVGLVPALLLAAVLAGCGGSSRDPVLGSPGAGIAPTVTLTSPVSATPVTTGVALHANVTATFSKPMSSGTITSTSFTLACPAGTPVSAAVTYDAATQVATLDPVSALPPSTLCVATVTTAAQDSMGLALASNFVWSFTTSATADTTRPTVTLTVPAAGAANVSNNTLITATFSERMLAGTISNTSFTVTNTTLGTPVAGSVSYSAGSRTATFTPTTPTTLANATAFSATISTAVTDEAGNSLAGNTAVAPAAGNHVWTFTTGAIADATRPTVTLTVPAAGAANVSNNTQITATFSESMLASTISNTSFTLTNTTLGTAVAGSVSYSAAARTATFTPTTPTTLANSTAFRATLSTAITDSAGNALGGNTAVAPAAGNHVWTFTTGAIGDSTPPTILTVVPTDGSPNTCLTKLVSATFSEPMDITSIDTTTFRVTDAGVAVAGDVSYDAATRIASFVPTNPAGFAPSLPFVVTVVSGINGVKDLAGNPLAVDRVWSFDTGTQPCPTGVNLRTAASFGAFGGQAGVTNSGTDTIVNGDLGTMAVCTAVVGFHDAQNVYSETPLSIGGVNGSIFCGPPAPGTISTLAIATQAHADATTAYNELAAMPPGSDPAAGQLGGLVLPPAVYTSAGGTWAITNGDLVLDAQGDINAVWVFQSAAALTVGESATPRTVVLINGAQAKNVYWQVGSAARIENGSTMVGTIIAPAGVTISTAGQTAVTTLIGRAIGLTASVTMVNTTIVAP